MLLFCFGHDVSERKISTAINGIAYFIVFKVNAHYVDILYRTGNKPKPQVLLLIYQVNHHLLVMSSTKLGNLLHYFLKRKSKESERLKGLFQSN